MVNTALALRYARAFSEKNMSSTIQIVRKLAPEFDPATGSLQANGPIPVYEGKARISMVTGPMRFNIGDELAHWSSTTVSIPMNAGQPPMVDDLVRVLTHPSDPSVVDRVFTVTDVEAGGQYAASRRLSVQGVQASQQWNWPDAIGGAAGAAAGAGGTA